MCSRAVNKYCFNCFFQVVGTTCSKLDRTIRPDCCMVVRKSLIQYCCILTLSTLWQSCINIVRPSLVTSPIFFSSLLQFVKKWYKSKRIPPPFLTGTTSRQRAFASNVQSRLCRFRYWKILCLCMLLSSQATAHNLKFWPLCVHVFDQWLSDNKIFWIDIRNN